MNGLEQYTPGPASVAQVRKNGEKWTLILNRQLRHAPAMVWQALIDPEQVRNWAPFDVTGDLESEGSTVYLTWIGTGATTDAKVTRSEAPRVLEFGDIRWELEPVGSGTSLTLWHAIDRRYISWGAAGWHISFDVLDRLLSGTPIGRIGGGRCHEAGGLEEIDGGVRKAV